MADPTRIPEGEVRYIYRKLGHLEAQVAGNIKGTDEVRAHSVETRAMLQAHAQEMRHSNAVNDQRWETVEQKLEIVSSVQEIQRVFGKVGSMINKIVTFLKSVAIISGVTAVVWFALKSGDLGSALAAIKILVGLE